MKILFLAANPQSTSRLKLGNELREIEEALKRTQQFNEFELIQKWDVRPRDFRRALLEYEPEIVHFSGHGQGKAGLVLIGSSGVETSASSEALAGLFAAFPKIKCVLLNACYSEVQAQAIVKQVDYVIGMKDTIYDKAAINFSIGFYDGLGYGKDIETAFNLGKNAILWEHGASLGKNRSRQMIPVDFERVESQENLPEHLKPVLLKKRTDVSQVIPKPKNPNIQSNNIVTLTQDSIKEYRERIINYLADSSTLDPIEEFQLATLAKELGISEIQANNILQEELNKIEQAKINYQTVLKKTIEQGYDPFNSEIKRKLKNLQTELRLVDSEVEEISRSILNNKQEQKKNLNIYQQALTEAVEREFPLSHSTCRELNQLWQSLNLNQTIVRQVEQPILQRKAQEYEQKKVAELKRRKQESQISFTTLEKEKHREKIAIEARNNQIEEKISSNTTTSSQEQSKTQFPIQFGKEKSFTVNNSSTFINKATTKITRKQFLLWASWGGGSLITTLLARHIFKDPTHITVAKPKYIKPTKDEDKFAGLPLWTVKYETVRVNNKGEKVSSSTHQTQSFKEYLSNGVILEMVSIPAGEFMMGSPREEKGRRANEAPQHQVSVSDFFIGKFTITQAQYKSVLGRNPAKFNGDMLPVESVSWNEAKEFCQKLSEKTGRNYRLPKESEWEYACRAGTETPFHFGATLTSNLANYDSTYTYLFESKGEYRQKTIELGNFPPNTFGLYDMHGNVWEWCEDDWHSNYNSATDDSTWLLNSNTSSSTKSIRGGSWSINPTNCRSASRSNFPPSDRHSNIGFRVVCIPPRLEI